MWVVTPDPATAHWASEPIDLGGGTWRSLVLGPDGIPIVNSAERAARDPHLAVLSVMAHGRGDDVRAAVAVALAATSGAAGLPEPLRTLCYALIESSLGDAARRSFAMLPQGQKFFSETQRRWFAEGEARSILRILERRGLAVSPEQRERILTCADTPTLEGWLDRALVAKSAEELFVGGTP